MDKKYGSYTNEEINDWQSLPENSRVLTSSGFGAWLMRRDERKGNRDLINELEKIKAEVEEIRMEEPLMSRAFECYGFKDKTPEDIKTEVIELLDERISELKGENK